LDSFPTSDKYKGEQIFRIQNAVSSHLSQEVWRIILEWRVKNRRQGDSHQRCYLSFSRLQFLGLARETRRELNPGAPR
jgi:hypothetical protein